MSKFSFSEQEDTAEDNKPELIAQTEKLYFALSHNLTKEAKNIIWDFLRLAKVYYTDSMHKKQWNNLLQNLQVVIDDFENQLSEKAVLRLYGLQRNAQDLFDPVPTESIPAPPQPQPETSPPPVESKPAE